MARRVNISLLRIMATLVTETESALPDAEALHLGEVAYGNGGSPTRLESMCDPLKLFTVENLPES